MIKLDNEYSYLSAAGVSGQTTLNESSTTNASTTKPSTLSTTPNISTNQSTISTTAISFSATTYDSTSGIAATLEASTPGYINTPQTTTGGGGAVIVLSFLALVGAVSLAYVAPQVTF